MDRKSEVKTVTSQLLYMLTFTKLNLNLDEEGNPKADPLVKRVSGIEGEQLIMQDGVLYSRTKDSDSFTPVEMDEKFARWNLTSIDKKLFPRVELFPLSQVQFDKNHTNLNQVVKSASEQYDLMLAFEEERRNYDLFTAEFQARQLVSDLQSIINKSALSGSFSAPKMEIYELYSNIQETTANILSKNGGSQWFESFMLSWIENKSTPKDMYAEANFKLNVMTKITFGKLVVRYAQLLNDNVSSAMWSSDTDLIENSELFYKLVWYVQLLLDERNMPLFPANDSNGNPQYIPKNCFFMMGDNRFNSLDLRHANDYSNAPLTTYDSCPVEYQSIIDQKYVNKKLIIGKALFRFWPLDRPMKIQ